MMNAWSRSAVFVWAGHSSDHGFLLAYAPPEGSKNTPGDIIKYTTAISPLAKLQKIQDQPAELKKLGGGFQDFPDELNDTELVILASCWTAKPVPAAVAGGKSLVDFCIDRGADLAIGWVGVASTGEMRDFMEGLFKSQATVDASGKYPSLAKSIRAGKESAKVAIDDSVIKAVSASGVDKEKIFMSDLPRYGRFEK